MIYLTIGLRSVDQYGMGLFTPAGIAVRMCEAYKIEYQGRGNMRRPTFLTLTLYGGKMKWVNDKVSQIWGM